MLFIGDSSRKINAVTKNEQIPQSVELKRCSICGADRAEESAGHRIVIVNFSIAKVSDPEFVSFHQCQSPWRVQISVGNETTKKISARVEHIDKTVAGPGHLIFAFRILLGKSYENFAIEIADA